MALEDLPSVPQQQTQQVDVYALQDENQYLREELEYLKEALSGQSKTQMMPQSADERFTDRVLKQRIPANQTPKGVDLWLIRSDFFEALALIPSLGKDEYRLLVRDWDDIETLAQGGGNEQIVQTNMERLAYRIQLLRSVGAEPIAGLTQLSALITRKQDISQTISTPQPQRSGKGFVEGFLSRFR